METLTVTKLKDFCRIKHIKNYSKLKKKELIKLVNVHISSLKIQKWIRNVMSKGEKCPISLEPIVYPCFAYLPKKGPLIYYNLHALKDFLITTGDFRDPSTREFFTDKNLKQMDIIDNYSHKRHKKENKKENKKEKERKKHSVYKASTNTKFYKKIKERENEIVILERQLDNYLDELIREIINDKSRINRRFVMDAVFFIGYRLQWRRLKNRSREHAEYVIKKNIDGMQFLYDKVSGDYDDSQKEDHEYLIMWLHSLSFEELS